MSSGEEILVVVSGAFGDRFAKICERYGFLTHRLEVEWGEACIPEVLKEKLRMHPKVKAVAVTYCETSTGVLHPIAELSRIVKEHSDALFIVDGVSCLGGVEAKKDDWEIDILVTGSQKALMLPPGLAFVSVGKRAWQAIDQNETNAFYLDLKAYRDSYAKEMTPYTPAVSLIQGLAEVCEMIEEEGLHEVIQRHELMRDMIRAAAKGLGLKLLVKDEIASPTVTAISSDGPVEVERLRNTVKEQFNVLFAGGQGKLKGRLLRIGHMGWCFPSDVFTAITYLELGLRQLNVRIEPGAGMKAAEEVYLQHV